MIAVRIESHILILNFLNENCSVFGDTERYNAENVESLVIDSSPLVAKDLENFDKFSLMTNSSDVESLRVFSLNSNATKSILLNIECILLAILHFRGHFN